MSPMIKEYSALVPFNPIEYVWIDFATGPHPTPERTIEITKQLEQLPYNRETPIPDLPLPFEKICTLLPVAVRNGEPRKGSAMVATLERKGDELVFQFWSNSDRDEGSIVVTATGTIAGESVIRISPRYLKAINKTKEEATKQGAEIFFILLRRTLSMVLLNEKAPMARCGGNAAVNARRIRRGKRPFFEWTTVTIAPRVPSEDLGGTHASPKPHMRRGHVRRLKDGRVITIKHCIINKHKIPEDGFVFHDYVVK